MRGFELEGRMLGEQAARDLTAAVRQILNLDEDLSEFYTLVADDPDLSWAAAGAGRMLRTQTVFEAAVKTICTTNVAWSATVRMVNALVDNLGASVASGTRAFPTAEAISDDAPRAALASDLGFVDAPQVREGQRSEG
jgi:3-methyladenine DNA glycosylase/8-oxoguanine DNA glycosylase